MKAQSLTTDIINNSLTYQHIIKPTSTLCSGGLLLHRVLQDRVVYVDPTLLQQVNLCIYLHRIDSAHHVER